MQSEPARTAGRLVEALRDRRDDGDISESTPVGSPPVSFVKARPGLRIEQINYELGMGRKELKLVIQRLVSKGIITTKGVTRSTTYFATVANAREQ